MLQNLYRLILLAFFGIMTNCVHAGVVKPRLYILSIGISNYNGPYAFANCDDDAILFASSMKRAYQKMYGDSSQTKTWLLLDDMASKVEILRAINEIITAAKDEDVFAFFFAGFTNQPKDDNGKFEPTWFYPATKKKVDMRNRTGFNEPEIITLAELKKLFDYIKSDKQLLFTEAGPSENFKREFVKSMIKTNPVIADIRKRNRVIIVPVRFGLDAMNCNRPVNHGPGIYFFSELVNSDENIFDLFSDNESERGGVLFHFRELQSRCKFPSYEYMSFFFEKEFVNDLQYYFSNDVVASDNKRGANDDDTATAPLKGIGKKYALVIGTNKFSSWDTLRNPINDASSIADTLSNLFGFTTMLLTNPRTKQIYNALYNYRNKLRENDQFLLYVAGHGHYDTAMFKDGFIVTTDSRALKADTFLSTYIPFSELRNITDNFRATQIMVLLDVCFSGAFDDNTESFQGNINYNLSGKLTGRTVEKKLQLHTRKYITAGSKSEQVNDDYNGQHSPFAYFLLEGLRRTAKEKKYLSSGMLFKFIQSYLEDTVPLQAGFGKDQGRLGSEFIFIVK